MIDLPHEKQMSRAKLVTEYARAIAKTDAVVRVATELNVQPRSIWRSVKYGEVFLRLPADLREVVAKFVNAKDVPVEFVREDLSNSTEEESRQLVGKWQRGEFSDLGRRSRHDGKDIVVTVPPDSVEECSADDGATRESSKIQAALAACGERMGFKIWIPGHDRNAVLSSWSPEPNMLVNELPLSYDRTLIKTIEHIDVIWLTGHSIARAFEVEHTTAVYSGILRMADLLALVPDMGIRFHIVAPSDRREKVLGEIRRPVFSLAQKPLWAVCTFLSYEAVTEIRALPHLEHIRDSIVDDYAELAEELD